MTSVSAFHSTSEMAPLNHMTSDSSDSASLNDSSSSFSDIEDVPEGKPKVPLRDQYHKFERVQRDVGDIRTDIDWIPCRDAYMARTSKRQAMGIPQVPLPPRFPSVSNVPSAWSKKTIDIKELIHDLSNEELSQIREALSILKASGVPKDEIDRSNFPLSSLANVLDDAAREVHQGRGFFVLRGLDPANFTFEDNILLYAGLCAYIGNVRGAQDNSGNVLVHIKDVGAAVAPDNQRQSPYANNAQPFHNDLGDIIALYCIDRAQTGGLSKLASTATVYNEIAARRPDLIAELAASNWAFDKHDGSTAFTKRPILFQNEQDQQVFFCFSRRQLTGSTVSPRPLYLPSLTEAQAEALDDVHFTAERHAITIQLEKGDIQFSNNLALFHAREAFQDGEDSHHRHMVRMWLRNEDLAWRTPAELQDVWSGIYSGPRPRIWHMSPMHGRAHVINRHNSCHG